MAQRWPGAQVPKHSQAVFFHSTHKLLPKLLLHYLAIFAGASPPTPCAASRRPHSSLRCFPHSPIFNAFFGCRVSFARIFFFIDSTVQPVTLHSRPISRWRPASPWSSDPSAVSLAWSEFRRILQDFEGFREISGDPMRLESRLCVISERGVRFWWRECGRALVAELRSRQVGSSSPF